MTVIAGRYQPIETVRGAGGPIRARDRETAQTVWLRPTRASGAALERARRARRIFHPALVTLFDVVSHDGAVLLAYEYVPAQTAAELTAGQPVHARRAAELVAEVADGVAELHARGLVHGAIAPGAVLVTLKGKAKLDRVGDPEVDDAGLDQTSDTRALGQLLGVLLTGGAGPVPLTSPQAALAVECLDGELTEAAVLAAMLRQTLTT